MPTLNEYDHIIIAFSGGKDSTAAFLHLLERGVDLDKVELWHHEVDGRETGTFMDWEVTSDYCRKFAEAFGVPLYFSWRIGGFRRALYRENQRTAPVKFETPDEGIKQTGGTRGKKTTRRMWPAKSGDLMTRWCSSKLKIDVGRAALAGQSRFENKKTLFITGERAQESAKRAKYNEFEIHKTDNRDGKRVVRHVDHWRPVLKWSEEEVWEIIERHNVRAHPAYFLGFGRCSCAGCIFGSPNQWKTLSEINPELFNELADTEEDLDHTIDNEETVREMAARGRRWDGDDSYIDIANSESYTAGIFVEDGSWELPSGAFGENCGAI